MSGLFDRLVVRSLAPMAAPTLRPRTAPLWARASASKPDASLPPEAVPALSRPGPSVAGPASPATWTGPRSDAGDAEAPAQEGADSRGSARPVADLPAPAVERRVSASPMPRARAETPIRVPRGTPPESPMPPRGRSAEIANPPAAAPERGDDRSPAPLLASVVPAPLPVAPRVLGATHRRESAPPAAPTAPDVHIHIGRIEFSSAQPSVDPRPAPARSAPAVTSLEDYLQGRRGTGA